MSGTISLDCFRCGSDGRLMVVMTGPADPPAVINLATGEGVTLRPAKISSTGFTCSITDAYTAEQANAWSAWLDSDSTKSEVALSIVVDGQVLRRTVRWPACPPSAATRAPRRRRKA
jgi:hypothetical protein